MDASAGGYTLRGPARRDPDVEDAAPQGWSGPRTCRPASGRSPRRRGRTSRLRPGSGPGPDPRPARPARRAPNPSIPRRTDPEWVGPAQPPVEGAPDQHQQRHGQRRPRPALDHVQRLRTRKGVIETTSTGHDALGPPQLDDHQGQQRQERSTCEGMPPPRPIRSRQSSKPPSPRPARSASRSSASRSRVGGRWWC